MYFTFNPYAWFALGTFLSARADCGAFVCQLEDGQLAWPDVSETRDRTRMFRHEASQDGLVTFLAFDDADFGNGGQRLCAKELHVAG